MTYFMKAGSEGCPLSFWRDQCKKSTVKGVREM